MSDIHSHPYRPKMACEKCVFGTGEHSKDCDGTVFSIKMEEISEAIMDAQIAPREWFTERQ